VIRSNVLRRGYGGWVENLSTKPRAELPAVRNRRGGGRVCAVKITGGVPPTTNIDPAGFDDHYGPAHDNGHDAFR
jgi:hypothetical protein